jgi:hypothetical protein
VKSRKSLKEVYAMARRRMNPARPRIWTAKRDLEMWKSIA